MQLNWLAKISTDLPEKILENELESVNFQLILWCARWLHWDRERLSAMTGHTDKYESTHKLCQIIVRQRQFDAFFSLFLAPYTPYQNVGFAEWNWESTQTAHYCSPENYCHFYFFPFYANLFFGTNFKFSIDFLKNWIFRQIQFFSHLETRD